MLYASLSPPPRFVPSCHLHHLSGLEAAADPGSQGSTWGRTSPLPQQSLPALSISWDSTGHSPLTWIDEVTQASPSHQWLVTGLWVISPSGTKGGIPNKELAVGTRCGEISWNSWLRDTTFTNYKSYTNFHEGRSLLHTPCKCVGLLPWSLDKNSVDTFLGIEWNNSMCTPSSIQW